MEFVDFFVFAFGLGVAALFLWSSNRRVKQIKRDW